MLTIFVVSDGTGETAERMVRSALVQFKDPPATVVVLKDTRTAAKVRAAVHGAARMESLILHTLVSAERRRLMLTECRQHSVDAMDLMGPMVERLAFRLNMLPQEKPGIYHAWAETKSKEIEAVAFAFRHDDGQHPEQLDRAEIVLVGPSRTMKTPTTLYLAYRGWFAANLPLMPEVPPPPELLALPADRVFCFVMDDERMLEMRRVRTRHSEIPEETYANADTIRAELNYARQLSGRQGWRQIDVTGKSVEEVAREIVTLRSGTDRLCRGW